MINNEPFEKVYEVLMQESYSQEELSKGEENDFSKSKAAIIMIDPFPSEKGTYKMGLSMGDVAVKTLGALVSQNRVKPKHVLDALDDKKASTYMISPVRNVIDDDGELVEKINGDKAIACGTLIGFGGFLHKDFRVHDYFLGRYNCKRMLKEYFTFPIDSNNPILSKGYEHLTEEQRAKYTSDDGKHLQIIPLVDNESDSGSWRPKFEGTDWPSFRLSQLNGLKPPIKNRTKALIDRLSIFNRPITWLVKFFGAGRVADAVLEKLKQSLEEWKLFR